MLNGFCTVSTSEYDDFVGLKFVEGKPKVTFPRGFRLSNDDNQTRKDILRLLSCIQKFSGRREGSANTSFNGMFYVTLTTI